MATWPATLPAPLIGSLNEQPPNNVIRSTMDKGPDVLRRRTIANTRPISFTMRLTSSLVATLDAFYVTDTFSGAAEFDYNHPRTGAACKARFVDRPSYSGDDTTGIDVAISLEIMP